MYVYILNYLSLNYYLCSSLLIYIALQRFSSSLKLNLASHSSCLCTIFSPRGTSFCFLVKMQQLLRCQVLLLREIVENQRWDFPFLQSSNLK